MVDVSGVIDTSGSVPRIDPRALASLLTGTVIWGWFAGWINFVDAALGGVTTSVESLGSWIENDLLVAVFAIASDGTAAAAAENAEALAPLGAFAQAVAVVQVALIVLIIVFTVRASIRRVGEVLNP